MVLPLGSLTERQLIVKRKGHAWIPGSGPEGKTCGDCVNYVLRQGGARHWRKCLLMEKYWTGGPGSDIRKKDPACREFSQRGPSSAASPPSR